MILYIIYLDTDDTDWTIVNQKSRAMRVIRACCIQIFFSITSDEHLIRYKPARQQR